MFSECLQYQGKAGFLIKFLKWYFLKYWQVQTRRVFAQTVTYLLRTALHNIAYEVTMTTLLNKFLNSFKFAAIHIAMKFMFALCNVTMGG